MKRVFVILVVFLMFASFANAEIRYAEGDVIIEDGSYTIQKIDDADYMEKDGNICYLKRPVRVKSGATFKVTDASCDIVRMYPESMIESWGTLYFDQVKVTSWDPDTGKPVELSRTDYKTLRPDIVTRSGSTYFSAKDSEFAYLGYYNDTSSHWGVALRFVPKAYINNCSFHDNYFGFYTFDSDNVKIKNSVIYDNLEYGLDFHDFSDNLKVKYNEVYNNGNHGLILSKYCDHASIMVNNVHDHTQKVFVKGEVRDYGTHGIMLHKESNDNLISRNVLTNNIQGITLFESHNNEIKTNSIFSDIEQAMKIDHSNDNDIKYNKFYDSDDETLFMLNSLGNYYYRNKWYDTDNIVYVKFENGETERFKFPAVAGVDDKLNDLADGDLDETYEDEPTGEPEGPGAETGDGLDEGGLDAEETEDDVDEDEVEEDIMDQIEQDLDEHDTEVDVVRDRILDIVKKEGMTREERKEMIEKIREYEEDKEEDLDKLRSIVSEAVDNVRNER